MYSKTLKQNFIQCTKKTGLRIRYIYYKGSFFLRAVSLYKLEKDFILGDDKWVFKKELKLSILKVNKVAH